MRTVIGKFRGAFIMLVIGAAMSASAAARPTPMPRVSAFIYSITADGTLRWNRHDGAATGVGFETPGAWIGAKNVGSGWGEYTHVFAGGGNIIYGIKADGTLEWRRHRGFGSGDDAWEPTKNIGRGWEGFEQVFAGGDGVIYTVTTDGKLWWRRHVAYRTGGTLEEPGSWQGPKEVGRGWGGLQHVFSTGGGVIYTVTSDGKLRWYRHAAYMTGAGLETPGSWEGAKEVGRGWEGLSQIFSPGDGIIYAVAPDGKLFWYRHVAYRTGAGLEAPGAWEGRTAVGRGWGDVTAVFALLPFNDTEPSGGQASGDVPADGAAPRERRGGSGRHERPVQRERPVRERVGRPERHGGISHDAEPSNQLLCRGAAGKIRVPWDSPELRDIYLFTVISSRLDSTGAAMLTVEVTGNGGVAAGTNGAGLPEGHCAWLDRPLDHSRGAARIRFEVPANAQLSQERQGTVVDTSPTAAERFPDAITFPRYLTGANHFWLFTAYDTGKGYLQATAGRHWKPTPGLGDEVKQPVDTRRARRP